MASLRRRLSMLAATWLVLQVVWLIALVPRDCCAAHRPAEKSCHEATSPSPADCRLSGACDGPMAALFALLSNHGILPEPTDARPETALRPISTAAQDHATSLFEPPDSPPPRA